MRSKNITEWADSGKTMIRIQKAGWFRIYCWLSSPVDRWFFSLLWWWRFRNSQRDALKRLRDSVLDDDA
jgi:hypothetical protein